MKGQSGNPKGCPVGAHHKGRPKSWLIAKCRNAVYQGKIIEFLKDVATGKIKEACLKDRMHASEMLLDRAYGKAPQGVYQSDSDGNVVPFNLVLRTVSGPDDPSAVTVAANQS